MVLNVYCPRLSQPSRSLFIFCTVNKIPFTEKNVDLMVEENKSEAYLAINPRGAVPAIIDGDFKLSECMTILKYLATKYKVADHWYPAELKARARVDEYLDWHHTGIRKAGVNYFVSVVLTPLMTGGPADKAEVAGNLEKFFKVLDVMDKTFLGDKKFLAGDEISIADLCAMSEIIQVAAAKVDVFAKNPNLKAWGDRVTKALNPVFDEANAFVKKFTADVMSK